MDTKGFFSNWIVRNLLGAAVAILALVVASAILLNVVTHHGQEIGVPDFSNLSVQDARKLASDSGVRIEVTDPFTCGRWAGALFFPKIRRPAAGSSRAEG